MKRALLGLICLLAGCAIEQSALIIPQTTFFYAHDKVRAIELLLRISNVARSSDGSWEITTLGTLDSKDFTCIISIPARWSEDPRMVKLKRADVVFSDAGDGAILDGLVQRHFRRVPSIFTKYGFGSAAYSTPRLETDRFEFQGFSNDPDDSEFGITQCNVLVDAPRRYVKLAFLTVGYGGRAPDEVYKWVRKSAQSSRR